eukprot:GHVU01207066.1.p2 GENE.GHVU01207066.1~~GHVU01207066.1.p2  ORF type:complete len:103 (+),score=7.55 GHVU01207066.1:478-786(+)
MSASGRKLSTSSVGEKTPKLMEGEQDHRTSLISIMLSAGGGHRGYLQLNLWGEPWMRRVSDSNNIVLSPSMMLQTAHLIRQRRSENRQKRRVVRVIWGNVFV